MMFAPVCCPTCQSTDVVKYGKTPGGKQRFHCRNLACQRQTFLMEYTNKGFLQEVKTQIVDMALNGSGIRDTARVLKVSPTTVIETLKKRARAAIRE
jgi:transposase-like protein